MRYKTRLTIVPAAINRYHSCLPRKAFGLMKPNLMIGYIDSKFFRIIGVAHTAYCINIICSLQMICQYTCTVNRSQGTSVITPQPHISPQH